MSQPRKSYDTTVARIAGNLLSGTLTASHFKAIGQRGIAAGTTDGYEVVCGAVMLARAIYAEVQRTSGVCGVRGCPPLGDKDVYTCELQSGHEGHHREGSITWIGYSAEVQRTSPSSDPAQEGT